MNDYHPEENPRGKEPSFFEKPEVEVETIPASKPVPIGIHRISSPELGIGGAYGSWGEPYDNDTLSLFLESRLNRPLSDHERMDLAELGFIHRHHIADLPEEEHVEVEIEVGSRFLSAAAQANGWAPDEVDAVLIGSSGPASLDYTERIARQAGIREDALKVSVHKACDGSMGALHLALNPALSTGLGKSVAERLAGKKVLVGGIEGLSRFIVRSQDTSALQLFANGAGIIGVVPGETMSFIVGKTHEVFDDKGVLAVRMYYPHSRGVGPGDSRVELSEAGPNHIRVAGMMHEPEGDSPVEMAGPMGMVKLFVRSGVQVVSDVVQAYREKVGELGIPDRSIVTAIVHHANYKINKLIAVQLAKDGIHLDMPWLLSEFGNVSAASNMIAFLRKVRDLKPGDHILFDGFGAGTYYDVFAVSLGR